MDPTFRRIFALLAAVATVVLGVIVLAAPGSDPVSLLAGAAVAAGAGILVLAV